MTDATPQVTSRNTGVVSELPMQEHNQTTPAASPQSSVPGCAEQQMEPKLSSGEIDPALLEELTVKLELEELLEQRKTLRTAEEKEKAWTDAADMVKTYSDEMVDRWNKVIDTYLVFAGLFSAILTAFNVQSYSLLQPPTPDLVSVLQQISLQLHSFSINPPFVNSTASPAVLLPPNAAAAVPRSVIWLNILWFSGLITSLTSALLGILVKQWLNEYVSLGLSGNSREAARRRQYRLNNLVKWRVGDIVIVIPVLLLISLGLFLAGLIVLLWILHPTVAIVASVLVGAVAVFTIGVTFLPLFNHSCAYLTPQTFAFYSLWRHALYPVVRTVGYYIISTPANKICDLLIPGHFLPDVIQDILLDATYLFPTTTPKTSPWYIHERRMVNGLSDTLDLDILNEAYDTTLDAKAVSAAALCLLDHPPIHILDYFLRLQKTARKRFFRRTYTHRYPKDELLLHQVLLCTLQLSAMEPFAKDCSQIWQHSYAFLPIGEGHTGGGNTQMSEQAVWLQMVASWLEHRVLNPDTAKVSAPIGRVVLDALRQYCLILSGEGKMTARRSGTFVSDIGSTPPRRAYDPFHREVLRCFELADTFSPLQLRDHKKPGRRATSPQVQTQLSCLRSARDFLWYAAHILSSSDPAGPQDHHVIRDHMRAVLFDVHSFLFCDFGFDGRKTLRHLSHEHLDIGSDLVNNLALEHLVLLPFVVELGVLQPERLRSLYSRLESMQRKQYFSGSQASVIQSLENFKLAIDAYERQYVSLNQSR